jgi:hypothetical protein
MVKSFHQFLNEAVLERTGEIKLASTGGGLKEPAISFETERNPESVGSVNLELYSKGGKEYRFNPSPEILAQMGTLNDMTVNADETRKTAMETIAKLIKQKQDEINADFLQLFTQLDQDIQALLKKHNITE